MSLPRALLLTASLVLLAACGDETSPGASSSPSAAPAASSLPASPTAAVAEPLEVVLRPDGLEVGVGPAAQRLTFGTTPADDVTKALQEALGSPGEASDLPDCGQGPRSAVKVDGLSVLYDGATFVGWTDEGSPERNSTTPDGLGIQSTLADLRSVMPDLQVDTTTLGVEWAAAGDGGLSGFLEGTAATSRVTQLSAGETCVFR